MARIGFSNIFVIAVLTIVSLQETSSLKCWTCSSAQPNSEFCRDTFDPSIITEQQRRWSYVECLNPPQQSNPYSESSNQRVVCRKAKQLVNDVEAVSRSCFWGNVKDDCMNSNVPSYIKNVFCETCDTDGCNGV